MKDFLKKINFTVYFFVFSLQSGVILTIVVFSGLLIQLFFMTSYTITVLNGWTAANLTGLLFAFLHAGLVLVAVYFAFLGAYREETKMMYFAALFMLVGSLIYIVATLISFVPAVYRYACVVQRCPDHVWLEDSHWRDYYYAGVKVVLLKETMEPGDGLGEEEGSEEEPPPPPRKEETMISALPVWRCKWTLRRTDTGETEMDNEVVPLLLPSSGKSTQDNQTRTEIKEEIYWREDGRHQGLQSAVSQQESLISSHSSAGVYQLNGEVTLDPNKNQTEVYVIRFPAFGLVFSILFNFVYLVFLLYTLLTYIAFANELKRDDFVSDETRYLMQRAEKKETP